jgi:hypothetical protein
MAIAIVAVALAVSLWAGVAVDLGRRAIALEDAKEKRRASDEVMALAVALDRRVERLEKADRDVAKVMSGGRR